MFFAYTQMGLFAAIMLTAGRSAIQRLCAAFLVTCAFVLAWYAPGMPLTRGLLAFLATCSLFVAVKIAFSSEERLSIRGRLLQVVSLPSSLRASRVPANLSPRAIGRIVIDLTLVGMALLVLLHTRHLVGVIYSIERLSAGVLLLYAGVQFVFDFASFCFLAVGLSLDSLHRTPIAARSLTVFWSRRWNRIVSAWLHMFVFLPLARRRCPRLGVFCAFLVSGVLHGWVILVAIGISGALATLLFFVVQGAFVLAEHRLRIHAWPVPFARGWTLAVLLASSPLIIDPYLRLFDL
jgi:hypothetical protein